jgi:hypothetical protein
MIIFHSQQSDCARHPRKNENAATFNFASQIAPSICAVMFTKRVKHDATIFKSRCSRTVVCYRLNRVQALLLVGTRFLWLANGSSKIQQSPARRSHNVREPSGKTSGEMSRPFPHICAAIAGLWPMRCRRMSARQLARQLASCRAMVTQCPHRSPRNSRCNIPRNISQYDLPEFPRHILKNDSQKL